MLELIVIGIFLFLITKCNNLSNENDILKQQLKNLNISSHNKMKFCPHCGKSLINDPTDTIKERKNENKEIIIKGDTKEDSNKKINQPIIDKIPPKKVTYNDTEIKNSIILIIGAVLIVLSAIIFLSSTWDTALDIEKTLIITAMFFVFIASSNIADKKLKVKKTSRIFLYIAYSYLPLVFLSFSLFNIIGNYLSFYGPGKYIYLALSSIILSIIYYNNMKKDNDIFFAIGGIIFQVLSISFSIAHISPNFNSLLLGISTFSLIYNYLFYSKKMYYYNENVHLKIINVLTISSIIITMYHRFFNVLSYENNIVFIINLVVIYFNALYSINKKDNTLLDFKLISPLLIMFICLELADLINQEYLGYQICVLFGVAIIFLTDHIYYETSNLESFSVSSFSLIILYLFSFFNTNCLNSYLIIALYSLYIIIFKYFNKDKIISDLLLKNIFSLSICITIMDYSLTNSIDSILLLSIYTIIFVITSILINDNNFKKSLTIILSIFMVSSYINTLFNYTNNLLLGTLTLLIALIYLLFAFYQKQVSTRYISYLWLITTISHFVIYFNIQNAISYIIPISLIITFIIEYLVFENNNESINQLLLVEFFISYFSMIFINNNIAYIIYLIITIGLIIHINNTSKNETFYLLPIISYNIFLNLQPDYTFNKAILSYPITIVLLLLNYYKKDNKYTLLSLTNVLLSFTLGDINKYIKIITLMICFTIYYIVTERDLWKASLYIIITILLEEIIKDCNLQDITVLTIGLYVILYIIISRTILIKHVIDYKTLEYIILSALYFIAISNYPNELNGMLFVLLLLFLTIYGYNNKMGPIFLTSIIFILINVFLLTRMFWLSIPWWIYILIIGFILIGFATRNEIKESNKKDNIIKEITKDLDL